MYFRVAWPASVDTHSVRLWTVILLRVYINSHDLNRPFTMESKESNATFSHEETIPSFTHAGDPTQTFSHTILGESGVWEASLDEAQAASVHEHSLSVRQALREYPWAVAWSLAVSMSIIMEGYDTILIGSLYAYPTYAQKFGEDTASSGYQIPARWQSAMGSGPQAGAIVGAMANGLIIQRLGYRPAFLIGLVLMGAFIFVSFFGMSVQLQAVGQILSG